MCSLSEFPLYSNEDQIPLCELDGKIHCSTSDFLNLHLYTNCVTNHPKVVITKDIIQQSYAKVFPGDVFLPGSDSLFQKLQDAWHERGVTKLFEMLESENNMAFKVVGKFFCSLQKTYEKAFDLCPFKKKEHFEQRNSSEIVVCMAWHPRCTKLAVATKDDMITVYSNNCAITPILKAKAQKGVTTIAWRPLTSGELAVACSVGVYIWTIDPNSVVSRTSFNSTLLLPDKYVSSISWSPQGDILMTCNGRDCLMTAWDPETSRSVMLKWGSGSGVAKLSWSPDGSKLVAATVSRMFRVWNCSDWSYESWLTVGGHVSHCVWSNDGLVLLFATSTEHCIYCLPTAQHVFKNQKNAGAYLVADLTRTQIGSSVVGGQVKGLAWDKSNRYLAVMFQDSPIIAIFYTNHSPHFEIYPGFFILGLPQELPSYICFQHNFTSGANLTICWSSGRVQYFPMIFNVDVQSRKPTSELHKSNLHDQTSLFVSFNSP
ncbi:aladin-like isoform X1 [Cimex lectularius]|uniref:Aladin seven-bladed propeller domain-containing protein n=2 Tax=Cimex lectularius TaxID=79782 RepID=A0A8I6TGC2_CIMLE|nr:aladin-like isoform X1 [Cimex lectularius]XP_014255109.1 aladin-like isoform X1 [Cimex lectularius]